MRETSVRSWGAFQPNLSEARAAVFNAVRVFGPGTAREVCEAAKLDGGWKRFSELERMGLIENDGQRKCRVSGRVAIVWVSKAPPRRRR